MDEDRLVEIEIKLSRSDDMLDELNKVIYEQQKKIERLETLYVEMLRRMPDRSEESGNAVQHEKPPHY
ncbi:MAG: SlyX family protein [Burkholderiaceae bacterium]|nr:SlyX family protein [Burkholderiaceae bacterium]